MLAEGFDSSVQPFAARHILLYFIHAELVCARNLSKWYHVATQRLSCHARRVQSATLSANYMALQEVLQTGSARGHEYGLDLLSTMDESEAMDQAEVGSNRKCPIRCVLHD